MEAKELTDRNMTESSCWKEYYKRNMTKKKLLVSAWIRSNYQVIVSNALATLSLERTKAAHKGSMLTYFQPTGPPVNIAWRRLK